MKFKTNVFCLALLIGLFSCSHNDKPKADPENKGENLNSNKIIIEFPLKKFSLPYDNSFNCDSNSLIYLHQAPFDTSYLFHIVKQEQNIKGVCYFVPQQYHRGFEDFSDKEHELLFFMGFSFKLNKTQWQNLKKQTRELISKTQDSTKANSPCFDCDTYAVIFGNTKRITGDNRFGKLFNDYNTFVRDSIFNYFLKLRNN